MNEWIKMSDEEYHASEALGHSGIVRLRRSPAHYKTPVDETEALAYGKAFHMACLQPLKFQEEYTMKPEGMNFATKDGKAWREMVREEGKTIITAVAHTEIKGMARAIRESRAAMEIIEGGQTEVSGFWDDPQYPDIRCKLRADIYNGVRIVDLKKCRDARKPKFTNDAYSYGYHIEAGWYLYGAGQITKREHGEFWFVAVESDPPHGIGVYKATMDFILEGLKECNKAVETYKRCKDSGIWECYPDDNQDLDLPGWVIRKRVIFE